MNPFLSIALVGLGLKIWAGYRLHRHWKLGADRVWLLLFLITSYMQTTVEVLGYLYVLNGTDSGLTVMMHTYYLLVSATIIIFPFSVATVVHKSIHPLLAVAAIALYALLAYCFLATNLIVQGYERYGYLATRVPGDFYWGFQSMVIIAMLLCPALLIQSYRCTGDAVIRIKSANLLIGFVPLGVVLTTIAVAMRMGAELNAAGVLPLLMSIYIVVLAENLRTDSLLDLRVYLPWTQKARLLRRLAGPLRQAGLDRDQAGELAEVYRRSLERQNHRVRLSKATEYVAEPLDAPDSAAVKQVPHR